MAGLEVECLENEDLGVDGGEESLYIFLSLFVLKVAKQEGHPHNLLKYKF